MKRSRFVLAACYALWASTAVGVEPVSEPGEQPSTEPRAVRFRTITQTVASFNVLVAEDGKALRAELVQSSGNERLDALAMVRVLERSYAVEYQDGQAVEHWVKDVPFELQVRAMNQQAVPDRPANWVDQDSEENAQKP